MTLAKTLRRRASVFAALTAVALSASLPQAARAQQVYVGSANGWDAMIAHPEQWEFVRRHADGFYVNFIQMLHGDAKKCAQTSAVFLHKNAYFESDARYGNADGFSAEKPFSREVETQQLQALLNCGFHVPYTSLNYGVDDAKLADLKHQGLPKGVARLCFAQNGPWTFGGDITKDSGENARMRAETARTDGISTDGPLSLWQADQGQMRSGSYSVVKYAHRLHKKAAVMVTPYDIKPRSLWLAAAQGCVRQHEDAGAKPDIWIVFEYATDTPTLPETVGGKPADTITGLAYWLIHHVQDPKHWARLTGPTVAKAGTQTLTLRNDSAWMDLCPVLSAHIRDPHHDWNVGFKVDGKDFTRQLTQGNGLAFVGNLRLWPGNTRPVQVALTRRSPGAGSVPPPAIVLRLRPHPSATGQVNQVMTLCPLPERPASLVALRR